jgi:hypothetical protein
LFVDGEIVEHDDIAGAKRGGQHLTLSIGPSKTAGAVSPSARSAATIVCASQ